MSREDRARFVASPSRSGNRGVGSGDRPARHAIAIAAVALTVGIAATVGWGIVDSALGRSVTDRAHRRAFRAYRDVRRAVQSVRERLHR